MTRKYLLPLMLLLTLLAGGLAYRFGVAPDPTQAMRHAVPVTRFTLANGLTVAAMPNARIPAVAHILFIKAGGADDPYGKSGLAHYLEHLMFTGTEKYPEGTYERAVVRAGGKQNAYTGRDFTAYYTLIATDRLANIMAMEADRLAHLTLEPQRVARELKVITEERNTRVENNPAALLIEQLDAITFLNHPYRQPLIGWAGDMAGLTSEDAKAFLRRYYQPANMVLVVAGDIDVEEVRRLARHYYGGLASGPAPKRNWPKEPPHRLAVTTAMADEKAHEQRLLRQYIAPSTGDGDTTLVVPLSVLSHYLGGGASSLLYRELVLKQKLATAIAVDYDELAVGPSLFRIIATPAPNTDLATLEAALDGVLGAVRTNPPAGDDLARAKTNLKASVIFAQDGLLPLAQLIGHLYAAGKDEQYFYQWPQMIEAVTAEQVGAAAHAVLDPERRVTGYLRPGGDHAL